MEALRQNNFNILLQGKSKGRGQGMIQSQSSNKISTKEFSNFKITLDGNQRKIDMEKEKIAKKIQNSLSLDQLNKQTTQFDDLDDSCEVCDRSDGSLMCRSCGHLCAVISFLIKNLKIIKLIVFNEKGRKKLKCPNHPSVTWLYDKECCDKCHSTDINEIRMQK